MSTAVFELQSTLAERLTPQKGFFQRLTENRERHAAARIRSFLLGRSDAGLAELGFSPDEVAIIRATGVIPASFWPARS